MDEIRKLIKDARVQAGLSIDDLASMLQIPYERILALEAGGPIEADDLFGLVNMLNIDPERVMQVFEKSDWDLSSDQSIEALMKEKKPLRKR